MVKKNSTEADIDSPQEDQSNVLPFGKKNYMLMLTGLGILLIGFLLMIGGASEDPEVFNESIFNFQRLTLSPILLLIGFAVEFYAIIYRPKSK